MLPVIIGVVVVILVAAILIIRRGVDLNARCAKWYVDGLAATDPIYNWHTAMIMGMIATLNIRRYKDVPLSNPELVSLEMAIDNGCAWMRKSHLAGGRTGEPCGEDYLRNSVLVRSNEVFYPQFLDAESRFTDSNSRSPLIDDICRSARHREDMKPSTMST